MLLRMGGYWIYGPYIVVSSMTCASVKGVECGLSRQQAHTSQFNVLHFVCRKIGPRKSIDKLMQLKAIAKIN